MPPPYFFKLAEKIKMMGDDVTATTERTIAKKLKSKNGKPVKVPDEYEEVTESNSRIYKDEFNDPDYTDGIKVDEIIKEVDDKVPSIKYASGGLAYMLGE